MLQLKHILTTGIVYKNSRLVLENNMFIGGTIRRFIDIKNTVTANGVCRSYALQTLY